MSGTLAGVRQQTRFHLRDRNPDNLAFSSFEVDAAINSSMRTLAARMKMAWEWVSGAINISNATDTYTLPGSQPYAQVMGFRLQSQQLDIQIVTRAVFDQLREGVTNPQVNGTGNPEWATVWEEDDQTVKVQFDPWPKGADVVDMQRSLLPATLTTDASVIPFDEQGLEALAYHAAGSLAGKSSPEVLGSLKLSPDSAAFFLGRADELVSLSRTRLIRQGGVERQNMTARRW